MTALMPALRLSQPRNIKDAIAARLSNPASRFLAGGTDLLVGLRHGVGNPHLLIDLSAIDELRDINATSDVVSIGAGVTLATLAAHDLIATRFPALMQAAASIAGPGHRALGTLGGNLCLDTRCIYYNQSEWWRSANGFCLKHRGDVCHVAPQGDRCHAAYTGDLAPALMVLGAEVEIAGPQGHRRIPLSALYVDDGRAHLTLAAGELIVAIHLPATPMRSAYEKVRVRGAIDYPLAGVAVALNVAGGKTTSLSIALTGTNSRPLLLVGTEAFAGRVIDDKALQEIDRLVQKQAQPKRTTLVSANYRRLAAAALTRRMTANLFAEAIA